MPGRRLCRLRTSVLYGTESTVQACIAIPAAELGQCGLVQHSMHPPNMRQTCCCPVNHTSAVVAVHSPVSHWRSRDIPQLFHRCNSPQDCCCCRHSNRTRMPASLHASAAQRRLHVARVHSTAELASNLPYSSNHNDDVAPARLNWHLL